MYKLDKCESRRCCHLNCMDYPTIGRNQVLIGSLGGLGVLRLTF